MLKDNCIEHLSILKKQADMQALKTQKPVNFARIINSLDVVYGEHPDSYVPQYFAEQLKQMDRQTANLTQKIIMLQCILNHWSAIFEGHYASAVMAQYHKTISRLLITCENEDGWSKQIDDYYFKDLAMAQRLMFPAGAQVVQSSSGFGFKQGLNGGLFSSLRFLWLTLRQGGCKGYYQIYTHTPELSEFNPQGWNDCYLRLAQMLEFNPQIKGIFGCSWFYDPQLKDISPRLMYLQDVPLQNGASSFCIGDDKTGNAIYSSNTRRRLHDQGKYTPKSYLQVWPRGALIKWAENYKHFHNIEAIPVGVIK
jgi:hypothetical protein